MLESRVGGTLSDSLSRDGANTPLLEVQDLHVRFETSRGTVRAVDGISYTVNRGEVVAIVGESGCGKSVSSLAIMRLLAKNTSRIPKGRILFEGRNLLDLSDDDMRSVRGRDISMIFQEPMTSLNPVLPIGEQIMEPLFIHLKMSEAQATARACAAFSSMLRWMVRGSVICRPILRTGLSEVIGSWKIMAMSRPRI